MRSIGEASSFYAQEYRDWVIANESQEGFIPTPNFPLGYPRDDSYAHTQFAISLLNGLLYDHPVRGLYNDRNQAEMIKACGEIPQLQCPTHPVPEQKLDYIVNAFVQPYTMRNVQGDSSIRYDPNGRTTGQGVLDIAFFHRIDRFVVPPASMIYITEGHATMPTNTLLYHDVFYGSQLPHSSVPRIANDQRHPGGITNIFFDGHAETMTLTRLDPGWPNSLGIRLKWFTVAPRSQW
jgi:prepilin-type processing-associated H-X9-DG protein